jgi:hypothetical protein
MVLTSTLYSGLFQSRISYLRIGHFSLKCLLKIVECQVVYMLFMKSHLNIIQCS